MRLPLHIASQPCPPLINLLVLHGVPAQAHSARQPWLLLLPPGSLNRVPASAGGIKGGNVTCAGWQVTLCDPTWHVSCRSGVATLRTAMHLLLGLRILLSSSRSSYTNLIDTQLHSAMRLISGCLQPTQLSWLPHTGVSNPQYDRRPNYE